MRLFKIMSIFIQIFFRFPIEVWRGCKEIQEVADWDIKRPK